MRARKGKRLFEQLDSHLNLWLRPDSASSSAIVPSAGEGAESMAIDRYCKSIDVSLQTLSASLYPDEALLQSQDGVGLYDGKEKSPNHFSGRLYLTSHRLIFVAAIKPHRHSVSLDLAHVRQTEYYAGFLKSSPKITLLLGESEDTLSKPSVSTLLASSSSNASTSSSAATISSFGTALPSTAILTSSRPSTDDRSWVCRVCGMSNVSSIKCSLCGIPRDKSTLPSSSTSIITPSPLSSSPSSRSTRTDILYSRTSTPPPLPPLPSALLPPPPPLAPETTSENSPINLVDGKIPCPTCTFLNHHSMSRCEVCDSPLPSLNSTRSSTSTDRRGSSSGSRPSTPDLLSAGLNPSASFVRLSFRMGGEKAFYKVLKDALGKRAWDWQKSSGVSANGVNRGKKDSNGDVGQGAERAVGGIDAIMKNFTIEAADRDSSLDDALKDLESLMSKAKDMIQLAQSINERLALANASSSTTTIAGASTSETKAAASAATSSLASLGLVELAITPDLLSEDQKFHEELAKELAALLNRSDALVRRRGVVGLDEIWCAWNRARGVALVSPKDLRLSLPLLPQHTSPRLSVLKLPSGLTILHTPKYSLPAFRERIWELLDLKQALSLSSVEEADSVVVSWDGLSTIEIAQSDADSQKASGGEGIGIGLIKEMLELIEKKGEVCRDQAQGGEVEARWFRNYFEEAARHWDGTIFLA